MQEPQLDAAKSPMKQLAVPSKRRELQQYMRHLGIRDVGVANFPIAGEALFRGLKLSATPQGKTLISDGKSSHWWKGGWTSLNPPLFRRMASQKEIQSRAFRARGVSAPENSVFQPGEAKRAWAWGAPVMPLVVKPYNGSQGRGVHVNLQSEDEFIEAFNAVSSDWGSVLVEQFVKGSEHRVHVVAGKVTAALKIESANVVGNGESTVSELVTQKNKTAAPPHKPIQMGAAELRLLGQSGYNWGSVLELGEKVYLRGNSNLASGGDSVDVTDDLSDAEIAFVESAAKCWPSLGVVGFDVLSPREPGHAPPTVLEMNHPAGMGGHHYPRSGRGREVAIPILNAMFPKTARNYPDARL